MATTTTLASRRAADRIISWWASLAVVLLVTAGGFAAAYIRGSVALTSAHAAILRAQGTAECVNRILAGRGPATNRDSAADLAFLKAIVTVFADEPGSAKQIRDGAALKAQASATYHIKLTDQQFRLDHPLGQC